MYLYFDAMSNLAVPCVPMCVCVCKKKGNCALCHFEQLPDIIFWYLPSLLILVRLFFHTIYSDYSFHSPNIVFSFSLAFILFDLFYFMFCRIQDNSILFYNTMAGGFHGSYHKSYFNELYE